MKTKILFCVTLFFVTLPSCMTTYYQVYRTIPSEQTVLNENFISYEDENCIVISQDLEPLDNSQRMVLSIPKVSVMKYLIREIDAEEF